MLRRTFILCAVLALAACAGPLLDETAARSMSVREVTVDASEVERMRFSRKADLPPERIARDVEGALEAELESIRGTRPVDVSVVVTDVGLVTRGQAVLLGGLNLMTGTMQVTDSATGQVIVPPTKVTGTADDVGLVGIVGALRIGSVEQEYQQLVAGFAAEVKRRVFGRQNQGGPHGQGEV